MPKELYITLTERAWIPAFAGMTESGNRQSINRIVIKNKLTPAPVLPAAPTRVGRRRGWREEDVGAGERKTWGLARGRHGGWREENAGLYLHLDVLDNREHYSILNLSDTPRRTHRPEEQTVRYLIIGKLFLDRVPL